jgi:D-glycero-alpha-D-manno-heptose-7-phosphate kinase
MVFYDGRQRDAQGILRQQSALTQSTGATLDALHDIKGLALEMIKAVRVGDLPTVGALMDSSWQAKQRVSDAIGSPHIATAYARAKSAGALGGKIAGAGGSGHLVLVCEPVKQRTVAEALTDRGWEHVPIVFAPGGAAAETEEDRCGSS